VCFLLPAAGKCVVYGAAGASPSWLLPITVDVGTNNAALLSDPLYIGQPQQRLRGRPYQQLILEVVEGLQRRFKRQVLVHWEDLAVSNAFSVLQVRSEVVMQIDGFEPHILLRMGWHHVSVYLAHCWGHLCTSTEWPAVNKQHKHVVCCSCCCLMFAAVTRRWCAHVQR
jgi:hypothetical protein